MLTIPFSLNQRVLFTTGGEEVEAVVIGVSAMKYGAMFDVENVNIEVLEGDLCGSQFPVSVEKLRAMSEVNK